MNTVFRKNLGVIFDACHVITCKTAKRESWVNLFIRDGSDTKEIQEMDSLSELWEKATPKQIKMVNSMIRSVLENIED